MYVSKTDTLLSMLAAFIGVGGLGHTPKIALYTNDISPAKGRVVGDYTFADFGGLTNEQNVVWGTPFLNSSQLAEVLGGLVTWITSAGTGLPATAFGYVLLNTAGSDWILAERFAEPFTFSVVGNSLSLVPRLTQDG